MRPNGVAAPDVYRYVPVRPSDLDVLLADSFSCAPRVLERFDCDVQSVVAALEGYTRTLLRSQREHDFNAMRAFVGATAVAAAG